MGIAVKIINKTRYFFKKYIIKKFRITSDRLDSISSNLLLIEIYYLFFNRSFRREKQSVLKGIVSFQKKSNGDIYNQSLLTRNIHRIEKGLIMKNTKNIFALDYIEETIKEYKKIKGHTNEIVYFKWYTDVLEKYFSVVDGNHPIIHKLYNEFKENKIEFNTDSSSIKSIPRKKQNLSNIDFEEFYKLNMQRRSVRWFEDIKVPRELIDKALLVARQAPSACNRQPFMYNIIDDPNLLKEVVKLPPGISGFTDNIKSLVVLIGNLDSYFSERDRHLIYIDASLSAMSFILALETLGLSSVCINWPDIEELDIEMSKLLKLSTHQRVIMCIAVGYYDNSGLVPFSEKKSLNELRKYNLN